MLMFWDKNKPDDTDKAEQTNETETVKSKREEFLERLHADVEYKNEQYDGGNEDEEPEESESDEFEDIESDDSDEETETEDIEIGQRERAEPTVDDDDDNIR